MSRPRNEIIDTFFCGGRVVGWLGQAGRSGGQAPYSAAERREIVRLGRDPAEVRRGAGEEVWLPVHHADARGEKQVQQSRCAWPSGLGYFLHAPHDAAGRPAWPSEAVHRERQAGDRPAHREPCHPKLAGDGQAGAGRKLSGSSQKRAARKRIGRACSQGASDSQGRGQRVQNGWIALQKHPLGQAGQAAAHRQGGGAPSRAGRVVSQLQGQPNFLHVAWPQG